MFGRYLEDFKVTQIFEHPVSKTITECDNNLFCLLTMNHHPLHLDREYAKTTPQTRNVVVGTYVLSLVVGMSVSDISGKAIANLGYIDVNHLEPVFVGDTLHAKSIVLDVRKSKSKPDRGIVKVKTMAFNQYGNAVLSLRRDMLIPGRSLDDPT